MKRKKKIAAPVRRIFCEVNRPRHDISRCLNNSAPHNTNRIDLSSLRGQSKQSVFIYTINEQTLTIPPHPFIPKGMDVPGRRPEVLCSLVLTLPFSCYSLKENLEEATLVPVFVDGVRLAVDIINPENLGTDLNIDTTKYSLSSGRDLSQRGLFYSLSNPPSMDDYEAAKSRLAKYYRDTIDRAKAVYWSGGDPVRYAGVNNELSFAAKFLGITDIPWARRKEDRKK